MARSAAARASADSVFRLSWGAETDWSPEELARMHAERVHARATLGDLPPIVISRAPEQPADSLVTERARLQLDLRSLSGRRAHVVAIRSGHNVHVEEPELVASSLRQVVESAKRRARRAG